MEKNKITQINCHAEFSSASHKILKQAVRCAHPLRDRLSASPTAQDDRNNESGRSMVEMLGVLAIIGVLSVGGIAGYTSAMNKHRANETVNCLMKRAMIVSGQRLLGQAGSLSGYTDSSPYTISLTATQPTDTTFTMTAANVPQEVCEKIKALDWPATNITSGECAEGNNTMTFLFNNDLSDNPTTPEPDTPQVDCGSISLEYGLVNDAIRTQNIQTCEENGCEYYVCEPDEARCVVDETEARKRCAIRLYHDENHELENIYDFQVNGPGYYGGEAFYLCHD